MSTINYDLRKIRAILFDVDGVLSANVIPMNEDGVPMRTLNIKDGYAIHQALKEGFLIGIITGGWTEAIRKRFLSLGIPNEDIYMGSFMKLGDYEDFLRRHNLTDDDIMYVGDDIPDVQIMRRCALPCCPADASVEAKSVAKYVSYAIGGYGVGRDVVEQVLKAQGLWLKDDSAFGW